jgi:hypothetical protein
MARISLHALGYLHGSSESRLAESSASFVASFHFSFKVVCVLLLHAGARHLQLEVEVMKARAELLGEVHSELRKRGGECSNPEQKAGVYAVLGRRRGLSEHERQCPVHIAKENREGQSRWWSTLSELSFTWARNLAKVSP